MEILSLIEVVGGVVVGGSFLEAIKWLSTRKMAKRALDLENKAKEQEIEKSKNGTVDEWERLSAQHEHDMEYLRALMADRDLKITELEKENSELKEQINMMSSSITQAQMLRCDTIACANRVPPFGYKKINFKTGELED